MNLRELLAQSQNIPAVQTEIKREEKKIEFEPGQLFRHEKRGTTVAIIKKDIAAASGQPMHLVVESRTGKKFKALQSNLKLAES